VSLGALVLVFAQGAPVPSAPEGVPPPTTSLPSAPDGVAAPTTSELGPGQRPLVTPMPGNEAPYAEPPPNMPPPDRVGTSLKGGVSAFYQRLFDVPMYGGGLSLAIGPFKRNRTFYLQLDLEHGSTDHGLSTWGGRLTFAPEWAIDRLRLGLGVGAGYLQLARVTNDGALSSFTVLCGELHASFDLVSMADSGAFYLVGAFRVDMHFPGVWGPTAALGFRTDGL